MAKPTIVTRAGKGSELTWTEGDANFTNLQNATFGITDGTNSVTNDLNSSLTLVPGANVTLTFNDTSKSLTIDATAEDARVICYNNTGSTIPKGSVVYINGSQGSHSTIALAKADDDSTSAGTIGIVYADISTATTGYVQTAGVVKGVNTLGLTEGNLIYLSPTTAGAFTQTKPTAPNHLVVLGWVVTASSTAGRIQVKVDNGYELNELHNVSNATPSDNDILKFISSTGVWTPSTEYSYSLPISTASVLGGVKIGSGISVDANGVISVSGGSGTVTSVGGTGTVNGLTLTGTVTTSGNLTLGGTLSLVSPPAIGSTTANTGAFTTLSASSTVSGTGFSTYLASPPAIGSGTANTGRFTTLSVSSTVSGTGINTLFAYPPTIGSGGANTGAFSTLTFKDTREAVYGLGTTGGTIAPDVANGTVQSITLNAALTMNGFTNPVAGQTLTLIINGGTAYTSITSTMKFAGGVKTLTATAGCIDILTVYYDGTNYYSSLGKGFA